MKIGLSPFSMVYYRTYIKYGREYVYGEIKSFMTHSCPDNNHPHAIDLGLPSGTKWACCNVGASVPEGYGDYYAWGETEKKDKYTKDTYEYYLGYLEVEDHIYMQDSCKNIGTDISGTKYDVAHVKWRDKWCMPIKEAFDELIDVCDFKGAKYNNVYGNFIIGPNGNRIFLPYAGHYDSSGHSTYEDLYWSATVCKYDYWYAYGMEIAHSTGWSNRRIGRIGGLPVRPVYK